RFGDDLVALFNTGSDVFVVQTLSHGQHVGCRLCGLGARRSSWCCGCGRSSWGGWCLLSCSRLSLCLLFLNWLSSWGFCLCWLCRLSFCLLLLGWLSSWSSRSGRYRCRHSLFLRYRTSIFAKFGKTASQSLVLTG